MSNRLTEAERRLEIRGEEPITEPDPRYTQTGYEVVIGATYLVGPRHGKAGGTAQVHLYNAGGVDVQASDTQEGAEDYTIEDFDPYIERKNGAEWGHRSDSVEIILALADMALRPSAETEQAVLELIDYN